MSKNPRQRLIWIYCGDLWEGRCFVSRNVPRPWCFRWENTWTRQSVEKNRCSVSIKMLDLFGKIIPKVDEKVEKNSHLSQETTFLGTLLTISGQNLGPLLKVELLLKTHIKTPPNLKGLFGYKGSPKICQDIVPALKACLHCLGVFSVSPFEKKTEETYINDCRG